jgi:hypothetical protein
MSNTTSLYSTTSSGNVTVPANNNTGLYNTTGVPQTVSNNITISGNISAAGNITGGNILTDGDVSAAGNVYADNFIGNFVGNIVVPGGNTQVLFNNNGAANASANLTFNSATNVLAVDGAVTATGNVSGNYFIGNGSQLTGINANYGNANVTGLLSAFGSNTVSTTGNVTAGYFLGDGSQLTNLPAGNYSNANVANFLPTYSGAITANTVSATGNVTGLYILGDGSQLTNLPIPGVYGNTQVAAFMAAFGSNVISTTGNVTAGYFQGNGSQLTGIVTDYSNANVISLLASFGSNSISTTGNITAGNFAGNGSLLTALTGANVTGTVANATFATSAGTATTANTANTAITANTANTATSATTAGTVTTAAQPNITSVGTLTSVTSSGNITGGNVLTGGAISATGNVTGAFIKGDGSQLTNLPVQPGTYSNSNVAGFLPVYTGDYAGANLSVSGNVTGAFLKTSGVTGNIVGANYVSANFYLGDGGQLSNITSSYGNANVTTLLAALGSNTISSTGNITTTANISGNYILGNGSQLTGLPAGYSNADVNSHLAAFGSNVISTTGNITAGYFVGNGSLLTNITGANVTGSVAQANQANIANSVSGSNVTGAVSQATFANTANAVAGGNVSGQVANALVAGTVYTNAQPNITSVGTLSALSVTGNIATGGILTNNYYYANGAPFSGGGGSTYGDANVNSLLAAWGSNTLSTTGNVSVGNLNMTGRVFDTSGVFQVNAAGNIVLVPTGSVAIEGPTVITGGQLTTGAVTYANTDGTVGQVLTTYGNGITYFSTVSGGSGSPGGSDSQIQYNNGGAFGGNAAMTFNNTTGNIGLGNIVINTNQIETVAAIDISTVAANGVATPWRVLVGDGYFGTINSANTQATPGTVGSPVNAVRLLNGDSVSVPNTGTRYTQGLNTVWGILSANISNANSRVTACRNETYLGGGTSNFGVTVNNTTFATGTSSQVQIGRGTNANLSAVGNIVVTGVAGMFSGVNVYANSTANLAQGVISQFTPTDAGSGVYGNIGNVIGYISAMGTGLSNTAVTPTNTYVSYYHPSSNGANNPGGFGLGMGSIARNAPNYFAFRNDDDLAQTRLGMLSRFHELNGNTTTSSGTVGIDKNNGQVQTLYPTGNVTIGTFTNFVTRQQRPNSVFVNAADTVTLIVQQGATPYTVTMPTGNTQIRYASGFSTVSATANTTVMISITGVYDYNAAANEYLVTISPEFS